MASTPGAGDGRAALIAYLRRHLIGPFGGHEEVLVDVPNRRYLMSILYPREAATDEMLEEEEVEVAGGGGEEAADDPVALSSSWMPSSMGFSFFLAHGSELACEVWGARYEPVSEGRKKRWRRVALAEPEAPQHVRLTAPARGGTPKAMSLLDGKAELRSTWRSIGAGHLVTLTLVNSQIASDPKDIDPGQCLHQVGLRCSAPDGAITEYPTVDVLSKDPEDEELRLLHRRAKIFAIGHGCAVDWSLATNEDISRATEVWTEYIPEFEVPALTHEGPAGGDALLLRRLANPDEDLGWLLGELRLFASGYNRWIADLPKSHPDIHADLAPAAQRVLSRLRDTSAGLDLGLRTLESDPTALRAFRLANLAMLMQMRHASEDVAGTRRRRDEGAVIPGDYLSSNARWRPFQLAFILLCLPSITDPTSDDRDLVDLLWFPTGGGKTEAYLALSAYQIFLRRLRSGDAGAGTTVITRYTLRLLTAQQFQRATTLICACEVLRRRYAAEMGPTPISIGLWIGGDQSPNTFARAQELREEMLEQERPENKFQLDQCPWCGTEIVPEHRADEAHYGVRAGNASFSFFCPSSDCVFHDRLPISVVDQELYQSPPTFLLATVDKWARLTWVEEAVAFFGGGRYEPPALIIQDEMHLLSGPLGTTVAVYEGAIEALATYHGARPKILASTATIRNANEQVRALFGRTIRVFPPPGLAADDSYFARVDRTRPGRRFLGVMAQSHTPQTTTIHTAAALLQAVMEVSLSAAELDAYWTLVAYHNSIRELGRTATLARDDIPSRIEVIACDQSRVRDVNEPDVVELTGAVAGDELIRILAALRRTGGTPGSIGVLVTTNMLSVGVDIPRLGLMLVNGQPKSTSEYIQATSRVGRSAVPGLIVAMFNSTKPRDRSHYEGFRPYHSALYRYVEPTSVTPFSLPSRKRALHAALVILMRHGAGLANNDAATRFRADDPQARRAIDELLARVSKVDPAELEATRAHLERLAQQWEARAREAASHGRKLYYRAATRQHDSLLKDFGSSGDGWETLHSMRSVDRQSNVWVIGGQQ